MGAPEILLNVVFYVFAAAAVAGALAVAASRNIVRSAFALLAVLFSAAALYAVMKADFIAAAQVLIYVGGILVLIIFAVMLTHRITDVKLSNESTPGPAAFCACLCLLFSLVVIVLFTARWKRDSEAVRVAAGESELYLLQYQGDGTTGLARGGSAIEDRVVVGVRVPASSLPKGAKDAAGRLVGWVEVTATPAKKPDAPVRKTAPLAGEVTKVALEGLDEGDWKWKAQLKGPDGDLSPEASASGKVDFTVYRGVTEPIANALAGPYLFAFEVVSVLLLAALVGAAFLARKEVRE